MNALDTEDPQPAPTVMFVDDDMALLQGLMRRLRKEPFELRTATSAEEALGILSRAPIDLVVSDMNMPGMTGMEFLARVAREHPDCIRIMLTGRPTLDVAMGAINSGEVYRFLTKPYDAGALAALIRDALKNRGARLRTNGRRKPHAQAIAPGTHHVSPGEAADAPRAVLPKDFFARLVEPGCKMRIQQYEINGVIGRGSMGIVLRAHDSGLARDVALKVMAPEWADSPVAHQRFAQEARFAAAIRHEHVVTIFAVTQFSGLPFLVMEYVPGTSLQDRLHSGAAFAVDEITRIGRQIALGLAAAHDLRLIHRDIKPANILLEHATQSVRITDFGLARAIDCDLNLSQQGVLLGTPLFMSPEQIDGQPLTPATDLFSLGSILYTLCAGGYPFPPTSLSKLLRSIAEDSPAPLRSRNSLVPAWLASLIEQLMAKDPADRIRSAAELAERLRIGR